MLTDAQAVDYARAWDAGDLPQGQHAALFAWARAWTLSYISEAGDRTRRDNVDLAAAFARDVGLTDRGGVWIVPALRLLKSTFGLGWPP